MNTAPGQQSMEELKRRSGRPFKVLSDSQAKADLTGKRRPFSVRSWIASLQANHSAISHS